MMGNLNLLKQMQARLAKMQEELAMETVEATAGGGVVRVTVNGQQKLTAVSIDSAVVDPDDVEMLQDLITAAVNEALSRSQALASARLSPLTGGIKIPGLG